MGTGMFSLLEAVVGRNLISLVGLFAFKQEVLRKLRLQNKCLSVKAFASIGTCFSDIA